MDASQSYQYWWLKSVTYRVQLWVRPQCSVPYRLNVIITIIIITKAILRNKHLHPPYQAANSKRRSVRKCCSIHWADNSHRHNESPSHVWHHSTGWGQAPPDDKRNLKWIWLQRWKNSEWSQFTSHELLILSKENLFGCVNGGGGFFLTCKNFGIMLNHSFPAWVFCFCFWHGD